MFWVEIFFAVSLAFIFALLLVGVAGWRHPRSPTSSAWPAALFLFVLLFLAIWAGGVWIAPFGPVLWGGAWLPFLIVGLIIALIVAAMTPARRARSERPVSPLQQPGPEELSEATAVFGVFFWILAIILIAAVIAAYARGA